MDNNIFYSKMNSLIDNWCEKRNYNCLRVILPVYPLVNGLTDDWESLQSCLKDIRNNYSDFLLKNENDDIQECINYISGILRNR